MALNVYFAPRPITIYVLLTRNSVYTSHFTINCALNSCMTLHNKHILKIVPPTCFNDTRTSIQKARTNARAAQRLIKSRFEWICVVIHLTRYVVHLQHAHTCIFANTCSHLNRRVIPTLAARVGLWGYFICQSRMLDSAPTGILHISQQIIPDVCAEPGHLRRACRTLGRARRFVSRASRIALFVARAAIDVFFCVFSDKSICVYCCASEPCSWLAKMNSILSHQ